MEQELEKPWCAKAGEAVRRFLDLDSAFQWALRERKEDDNASVEGLGKRWEYKDINPDVKWRLV